MPDIDSCLWHHIRNFSRNLRRRRTNTHNGPVGLASVPNWAVTLYTMFSKDTKRRETVVRQMRILRAETATRADVSTTLGDKRVFGSLDQVGRLPDRARDRVAAGHHGSGFALSLSPSCLCPHSRSTIDSKRHGSCIEQLHA